MLGALQFELLLIYIRASGGKMVDASPSTEKAMVDELEKLSRQYGAKGADFSKFPTFNFVGMYYNLLNCL